MTWQVIISLDFIRKSVVSVLTFLLCAVQPTLHNNTVSCIRASRRARRPRFRRSRNHRPTNRQGMRDLAQAVAEHSRPHAPQSPALPSYRQATGREREPSRSPPRTRRSSVFYSECS